MPEPFEPGAMKRYPILNFFSYGHLPQHLQECSEPFYELAAFMTDDSKDCPYPQELAAGLRKLLEAKDCFVRSQLPRTEEPKG